MKKNPARMTFPTAVPRPRANLRQVALVLTVMALAVGVSACGSRGPLERPPGPAPDPWLGKARSAQVPSAQQALSTNVSDLSMASPSSRP